MTLETSAAVQDRAEPKPAHAPRKRLRLNRGCTSPLAHGEPYVWLTGAAVSICLAMIILLLLKVATEAIETFWPKPLVQMKTVDGRTLMGEPARSETFLPADDVFESMPAEFREKARAVVASQDGESLRTMYRTGNFELTNEHFTWVSDFEIAEESLPEWGVVVERMEWGRFYGVPTKFLIDGEDAATTAKESWAMFQEHHAAARRRHRQVKSLEKHEIGYVNKKKENARLAIVETKLDHADDSAAVREAEKEYERTVAWAEKEYDRIRAEIDALNEENARFQMTLTTSTGAVQAIPIANVVRAYPANQLGFWNKLSVYVSRWWEFLTDDPREANSEGGVFPAIFGTVLMTLIMSFFVVPFGVLAALYLREYAKGGPIVAAVRIAINNLAGVPSIVFGVFGFGFFCYKVGGFIDGGPSKLDVSPWPAKIWFLLLAILAACSTGAFLLGIYNLTTRPADRTTRHKAIGVVSMLLWLAASALFVMLIVGSPFFEGFYRANLPAPTFGKGGLLWSSLTLALLTLPVVIVATEEALSAVPNSMREGSYACGASKWQTIKRIVLPRAMPGIMTGMILAMARGAGEVAPLMLVGAVKLAPELPVAMEFPSFGSERSFMHLGFHIYDLGFQSQNSEAAVPMVYTTTLLLIMVIALLNVVAIFLRGRLRRKFVGGQF